MANHNVATLVKALSTAKPPVKRLRRGVPGEDGDTAPQDGECFTAKELAAAEQLVMLSESSSEGVVLQAASCCSAASSSSAPSVSNARPQPPGPATADEDEEEDEAGAISKGPSVRKRRHRSIHSLYEVTGPIDVDGKRRSAAQRRRKNRT